MDSGKFIVIEGIDGVGKTTALQYAHTYLLNKGYNVVTAKDPGTTAFGYGVRELILSDKSINLSPTGQALLFGAARRDMVEKVIMPALLDDAVILCDRYILSALAYQSECPYIKNIIDASTGGILPCHTIVLDAPIEVSELRLHRRSKETMNHFDLADPEIRAKRRKIMLDWYMEHKTVATAICVNAPREIVGQRVCLKLDEILAK